MIPIKKIMRWKYLLIGGDLPTYRLKVTRILFLLCRLFLSDVKHAEI